MLPTECSHYCLIIASYDEPVGSSVEEHLVELQSMNKTKGRGLGNFPPFLKHCSIRCSVCVNQIMNDITCLQTIRKVKLWQAKTIVVNGRQHSFL